MSGSYQHHCEYTPYLITLWLSCTGTLVEFQTLFFWLQVFAASSAGFRCTGFEINSLLLAYSRGRAWWRGIPHTDATFVKQDLWKVFIMLVGFKVGLNGC